MLYYIYGITDIGSTRSKNEDRMLIGNEVLSYGDAEAVLKAPFIAAVCDGVGGERGGEIAAQKCLAELSKFNYSSLADVKGEVMRIHEMVIEYAQTTQNHKNMQTTLCGLAIDEQGNGYCLNVGDSRLYRYANGAATRMSTDHTLVRYLYDMGEISLEEMKTSPDRNVIISSVGGENQPRIDFTPIGEKLGSLPNDAIIICTDGISDYIGKTEIEICMALDEKFDDKIDALYRLALSRGSSDNLTIIGVTQYHETDGDIHVRL